MAAVAPIQVNTPAARLLQSKQALFVRSCGANAEWGELYETYQFSLLRGAEDGCKASRHERQQVTENDKAANKGIMSA